GQNAGDVSSGPGMAGCQAEANRIDESLRDNRDGVCQLLESDHTRCRACHKHVRLETKQLFRKRRRASAIAIEVAAFKGPVLAFPVSEFPHALQKSTEIALRHRLGAANQTGDQWARRSLGYPRNWPRSSAASQPNDPAPVQFAHGVAPSAYRPRNGLVAQSVYRSLERLTGVSSGPWDGP